MSPAHALNGHDGPSPAARSAGPDTVKTTLTPKRAARARENDEYAAFARRVLRALGYSWAEIGSRLGITRQAAWQRWGGKP